MHSLKQRIIGVLSCYIFDDSFHSRSQQIKSVDCTRPGVNTARKHALWLIVTCCCRFASCNDCITLVEDVNNGRVCACVGAGSIWEIAVPFSQFWCKYIIALKEKSFIFFKLRDKKS